MQVHTVADSFWLQPAMAFPEGQGLSIHIKQKDGAERRELVLFGWQGVGESRGKGMPVGRFGRRLFFMMRIWTVGMTMALALPLLAHAQAGECLDPTAGLAEVGAVRDFPVPPSAACVGPDYASSLGPIIDYEALAKKALPTAKPVAAPLATPPQRPRPEGPLLGAGEGVDMYDLEAGTGGATTTYKDRQLERLGELDALQGKPLNMEHAQSLSYLKGYTQGNERRVMPKPWR